MLYINILHLFNMKNGSLLEVIYIYRRDENQPNINISNNNLT